MAKTKLFIGFKNGKALTMVFTSTQDYANAVNCDYFVEACEGTEKQQLEDWLRSRKPHPFKGGSSHHSAHLC